MTSSASVQYPALLECSTGRAHSLAAMNSFLVGRSQEANLPVLDPGCSRQQFRIVRRDGVYLLETLSATNPTYCDGQAAQGLVPLRHGVVIQVGPLQFHFLERSEGAAGDGSDWQTKTALPGAVPPPLPPGADRGATMIAHNVPSAEKLTLDRAILVTESMLIGRDADRVQVHLPHSLVSRLHAQIVFRQGLTLISDLNSANGTFVKGRRVMTPTAVHRGDRIDIGPFSLYFDGASLLPQTHANNVELICHNLTRTVKDRDTGQPLKLLDDITLVIQPKEFVCVLGPSGSGKSTLLSALSARVPADTGSVTINGEDFYKTFDALKNNVAVVPQKDVLHDLLSVEKALDFTARLRFPPDTSSEERRTAIGEMLATVGLDDRRSIHIQHLSGGQIKRASLANEILSKPSLLFLDEVTSGLDEETDREMMQLFRKIAEDGKTVLCITHSLANVEDFCHLVVVLTVGGKLAFVGKPAEALKYFDIERLGHVYPKLKERSPDEWKGAFRQHNLYRTYIDGRLPQASDAEKAPVPRDPPAAKEVARLIGRQLRILASRYLRLLVADTRSLLMTFGQCLLVAVLLIIFYGSLDDLDLLTQASHSGNILFLMAISCLWFGCNNSAKEIVKERTIYLRERDVNLLSPAYYGSKLLVLGVQSIVQAAVLLVLVRTFTQLPGSFTGQLVFLSVLSLVGVTLGLLISSASTTNDMAVAMVPNVLIPQIILAGVIAPVEGFAKVLAQGFITLYWAYRGLATVLPEDITEVLGSDQWSATGALTVLVFHAVIFAVAALVILEVGAGGRLARGKALDRWLALARAKLGRTH